MLSTKERATERDLGSVKITVPDDAGGMWHPVPHLELVEAVRDRLRRDRRKVEIETYHLGRGGADLVACFTLRPRPAAAVQPPAGYRPALGVATSNARRRALTVFAGLAAGDRTGVTLAEAGRLPHSGYAETTDLADVIVRFYEGIADDALADFLDWTPVQLRRETWQELLLRAGREGVMPWSRIGDVDERVRAGLNSSMSCRAWGLLRAFSSVLPRNPPQDQMDQSLAFTQMVRGEVKRRG